MTEFIVDASHYQASMSIESLPAQGFSAAIFKVSEGTGWIDASFADFVARAKAIGLACAAYHFVHPGAGDAQAALVARLCPKDVPVWLDAEAGASVADAVAVANGLVRRGLTVAGIYSGSNPGGSYGWWRAAYLRDPSGYASSVYQTQGGDSGPGWVSGVDMWQFCQHGRVSGYSGDVDFSAYRGTKAQLLATGWFWTPATPAPTITTHPEEDMRLHKASDGTVWAIGDTARVFARPDDAEGQAAAGAWSTWTGLPILPVNPQFIQRMAAPIDPAALAAAVSVAVHPTVDAAAIAAALAPLLHAGATVDEVKALLTSIKITTV